MKQWRGNGKNRLLPTLPPSTPLPTYTHCIWPRQGTKHLGLVVVVQEKIRCHIFHFLIFPTMQYTFNEYPRSLWNTNDYSFLLHSLAISSLFQVSQIFPIWHFAKWEIIILFNKVINANNLYLKCNFILHTAYLPFHSLHHHFIPTKTILALNF